MQIKIIINCYNNTHSALISKRPADPIGIENPYQLSIPRSERILRFSQWTTFVRLNLICK